MAARSHDVASVTRRAGRWRRALRLVAALAALNLVVVSRPAAAQGDPKLLVCAGVCGYLTVSKGYTDEAAAAYFAGCVLGCMV